MSSQTAAATGGQLSVNNCGVFLPHLLQRLHAAFSHSSQMEAVITAVSVHPQRFRQHEKCAQKFHPRREVRAGGRMQEEKKIDPWTTWGSAGCSDGNM